MFVTRRVSVRWCFVVVLAVFLPVYNNAQTNGASASENNATPTSSPGNNNGTHEVIDKKTQKTIRKVTSPKVKVMLEEPYVMRKNSVFGSNPGGSDSLDDFDGLFIDILKELKRRRNLDFKVSVQAGEEYGYEYAPGNWSGLIGSVQKGDADLAVAALTIVAKTQEAVEFTLPVMSAGLRILYKVPKATARGGEAFSILVSPFTPGLWFLLLMTFAGVSGLLYVIGRFSPYEDTTFVGKAATYEGLTLLNSFLYSFSSMTFQGYTAAPRSISGRILAAFWWMFVVVVIAAYCASLCAVFLALKPSIHSLPFASFDELSKQDKVAYGIVKGKTTSWYLENSRRPLQQKLWNTVLANKDNLLLNSVNEGILRLQRSQGDFALIMEGPQAEYLSEKPPCDLMHVGEELGHMAYGFACAKGTDVCSNINSAILELQEEDYIYDLKRKWLHKGCRRDDASEYLFQGLAYFDAFGTEPDYLSDRRVTLHRFSGGFLLLTIGLFISGAILLVEIFYSRRRGTAVPQRMPRTGMNDQARIDQEYRDEEA